MSKPRREDREKAAKAGRRKYLADQPCSKCEEVLRYTSNGRCVWCTKERAAKQYARIRQMLEDAEQ